MLSPISHQSKSLSIILSAVHHSYSITESDLSFILRLQWLLSDEERCGLLQIFSAAEKGQLDVYGLLAVLRNQLQTDDSFVLNRILARIKEGVHNLPPATEEEDAVLLALKVCFSKP